jgi:PAS domain S-box-containing protein
MSGKRYQQLFEQGADGSVITDTGGRIEEVNGAAADLLQRTRKALAGKLLSTFVVEEQRAAFRLRLRALQAGDAVKLLDWDVRVKRRDRSTVAVALSGVALHGRNDRLTGLCWSLRDASERHRADAALDAASARAGAIVDAARDGIISIDEQGMIASFNPAAERMFGYAAGEMIGRNVAVLMPPPVCGEHDGYLARHRETGGQRIIGIDREVLGVRKDGARFPLEISVSQARLGGQCTFIATVRDITAHKEIAETLRRERDFAESLIETAQVIVLVLDPEARIVRFNRYMEELSGYRLAEVQGRDWFTTFLPVRDYDRVRQVFDMAVGDMRVRGNINPIVIKDGSEREIEWYGTTLKDADGMVIGLLSVGQDITERKRAERRQAAQYAVTRVLAEASTVREAMPQLLQAVCEGLGWELGELWRVRRNSERLSWDGMWHVPSVSVAEFESVSRGTTLARGDGLPGQVWARGEPVWMTDIAAAACFRRAVAAASADLHGAFGFPIRTGNAVIGVMAFFSRVARSPDQEWLQMLDGIGRQIGDFIERKRIEQALFQMAAIVESSEDAIVGTTLDGIITSWNAGAEKTFGYSAAEVLGHPIFLLLPPERADESRRIIERLRRGERIDQYETIRVKKDGSRLHISLSVSPIRDASGRITGVSRIARDITERKRAEVELRELQKLAQQRERLADVGVITAKILHDLANPLAGLSMQAQLILRRAHRSPTQPLGSALEPAQRIVSEVHHLDAIIRDFMDFAREQNLDPRPVDMRAFLGECLDLWEPLATTRSIALALEAPNSVPTLRADPEKLRRVFDNLLKNAIEAIERGPGNVRIRISVPAPEKICVAVEDTGPGIPATVQAFRLFETTKPHGTGLGLCIAKQIVQAHGGSIEFALVKPHGTVFYIELPLQGPGLPRSDASPDQ